MAAYNPDECIFDQIESVFRQSVQRGPAIRLYIRDDASTDPAAANVYKEIKKTWGDNVCISHGADNAGPARTFLSLLTEATAKSDIEYVGFCDQDDVWLPGKLDRAISVLEDRCKGSPGLYCGTVCVTDAELRSRGTFPPKPVSSLAGVNYRRALVENLGVGSTMVLNRPAAELMSHVRWANDVYMHDAWCFLVVSVVGAVIFDPSPYVLYRQHDRNVLGASPSGLRRVYTRLLKRLKAKEHGNRSSFSAQVESFIQLAKERNIRIPEQRLATMRDYTAMRDRPLDRIRFVFFGDVRKVDCVENTAFRVRVLLNDY